MKMTDVFNDLQNNANPSRRKLMLKNGGTEESLGVNLGYLRQYANKIKSEEKCVDALWNSDIPDANLLAAMVYSDKQFTQDQFQTLVEASTYIEINDELCFKCSLVTEECVALIDLWIDSDNYLLRRSAWDLVITLVQDTKATDKQIQAWLKRIKKDMLNETSRAQETMNRTLAEIGIHYDDYTTECMQLGETLGLYKDLKVSKGCYSPYAPNWITIIRKKLKKPI